MSDDVRTADEARELLSASYELTQALLLEDVRGARLLMADRCDLLSFVEVLAIALGEAWSVNFGGIEGAVGGLAAAIVAVESATDADVAVLRKDVLA